MTKKLTYISPSTKFTKSMMNISFKKNHNIKNMLNENLLNSQKAQTPQPKK